jgi:hypothetical protein
MPRYYFQVHDGLNVPDRVGTELEDKYHARAEALQLASDLLRDKAVKSKLDGGWHMEVMDERNQVVFRLVFSILEAAVIRPKNS